MCGKDIWFGFRSKDGRAKGYCPAEDEAGVARFANYPIGELIIKRARWDGKKKMLIEIRGQKATKRRQLCGS
jgi:hypothetical protein